MKRRVRKAGQNQWIKRQLATEALEPRNLLTSLPIISEFQAINGATIFDEDGDSSDWVEIRNPGTEAIQLEGWYLTDNADDLNKWRFPTVTVAAGEEIIVFASGKDRTAAGELHTNFRLSGDGEFLALVQPDGTIAQDFGDQFPPQIEDQSYGLAHARESTLFVGEDSSVRSLVPADDLLLQTWTQVQFDASEWLVGTGAVGYENLRPTTTVREEFDATLAADWTVDLPDGATDMVEVDNGGLRFSVPTGKDTTRAERGLAPIVYRDLPVPNVTDWEWIAHVQKDSPGDRGPVGIMIFDGATGKPAVMLEQMTSQTFKLLSGGAEFTWRQRQTGTFFLRLARNEIEQTWTASAKVAEDDEWHILATVTDGTFEGPVVADPKLALYARTPSGTLDAQFLWVDFVAAAQRPTYGPLIGLDIAEQMSAVNASAYVRYPFQIDGDPSRFDRLSLGARFDDGFKAHLNGVEIASANSPLVSTWDSSAAGEHGAVLNRIPLEQFDVTDSIDLLRGGENVLAIHGMNVTANDADFLFQGGLVGSQLLTLEERVFTSPTPGAPNLAPNAPAPQVTAEPGVFVGSHTIEMGLEQGAPASLEIRYTLDGTEPTADSELYSGPFTITKSALLQARTFDTLLAPDFQPSNVTSKTFIALSDELQQRTSNMPLLVIDTLGQGIPTSNTNDLRRTGVALFDINQATGTASLGDTIVDYLGRGGIRRRGASTAAQAKPQLAFETWGPAGANRDDDFDTSLLGLPAESDWVLHAPFGADPAFMRNRLGFELSNQMGRWAPHTRFVEVYLNDGNGDIVSENHYVGIYVLMEKIKPGPDRVDIADIGPEDDQEPAISGGYIWKVDRPDPDAPSFSAGGQGLNWVYPESPQSINAPADRKATEQQQQWVVDHFAEFQQTLSEPDINDPDGYTKYIDVDAWIDYHLMQVLMYNADAMGLSIYFHKDRNDKIAAGPLWDLNLTAESTRIDDDDPTLWRTGANFFGGTWWRDLVRDPGFWQQYVDRWHALRNTVLSDENISAVISGFAEEVGESAQRNAARWPDNAFRDISGYKSGFLDGTFQGEVEHMRHWMVARTRFMDSLFTGAAEVRVDDTVLGDVKGVQVFAGQEIEIISAPLEVFNDTRLVSGVPGEAIASYLVPTDDELGDTWTLPTFDDSGWQSGPTGLGFDERDNVAESLRTEVRPQSVQEDATNILARIPFDVASLADTNDRRLVLRMKYNDGYVAYLNGVRVARNNLRDSTVTWDTRAQFSSFDKAREFEEVDISRFKHLLVEGTNVLSVRGLDASTTSREMLLLPELVLRSVGVERNPDAKVYYTVDGTDPRGLDGNPSPDAMEVQSGETVALQQNTRIIARNLDSAERGEEAEVVLTDWSAPIQYDFVVSATPLVIFEIHYNPAAPNDAEIATIPDLDNDGQPDWDNEEFEFVEIHNLGEDDASLVGVALSSGVEFDLTTSETAAISPGGFGLVVKNQAAFELRYGSDQLILGEYTGNLNNNGERLELIDWTGAVLSAVSYGDNELWPQSADGAGASLQIRDPNTPADQFDKHYRWRGSTEFGGSPGRHGAAPVGVVINEVLTNTDPPNSRSDSIELFNTTDNPIDIGGWYLSDSANDLLKFQIPAATVLDAGAYLVFDEEDFNSNGAANGFALSSSGDDVWLVVASDANQVTTFVDDIHFGAVLSDQSLGRAPDHVGRLAPMSRITLGCGNAHPRAGALVISEVNYNPGDPVDEALAIDPDFVEDDLEFVEIHNPTSVAIDLTDWRLRGGVDLGFDAGMNLAAGESLIVISFNPNKPTNADRVAAFRAHYGIDEAVQIIGGWDGQLSDSGETVRLERAINPPPENPFSVPYLVEDGLLYDDQPPWFDSADGGGGSLQRGAPVFFGDNSRSWTAALPTPGIVDFSAAVRGDFDGDGHVDQSDIDILVSSINLDSSVSYLDLDSSSGVDGDDVAFLVEKVIGSVFGDANLDGSVNAVDLDQLRAGWQKSECLGWSNGDFRGDGLVNAHDLNLLAVNWQHGVGEAGVGAAGNDEQVGRRIPRAPLADFLGDTGIDQANVGGHEQFGLKTVFVKHDVGRSNVWVPRPASTNVLPALVDGFFAREAVAHKRGQFSDGYAHNLVSTVSDGITTQHALETSIDTLLSLKGPWWQT